MIERSIALFLMIVLSPVLAVLSLLIVISDGWPFWFCQKRVGKHGKIFWIYKFRSMKNGSEKIQSQYRELNEADGPVFKIYNDPRLTKVGKVLFHSGLDELLQLINIVKGEMGFVGPRPLPIAEREKVATKYRGREEVLPGIISPWIFDGYHKLSFNQWMASDLEYVKKKNRLYDLGLFIKAGELLVKLILKEAVDILTPIGKSV